MGMPPTGKPIVFEGITILHFEDGKCVRHWSQADFIGLLQPLGALPATS
jgi:predicted ester cyclase